MKNHYKFSKLIVTAAFLSLICFGCTQNSEVKTTTNQPGANISANQALGNNNSNANR